MPGLRLTELQVERLCAVDASTSASALRALVSAGLLTPMPDGGYGRADLVTSTAAAPLAGARARIIPSPWRQILCLVDLDTNGGKALSAGARSALRYASALAVTHRARLTALQVISQSLSDPESTPAADRLTQSVRGEFCRGPIDVHVATGAPHEQVARVAKDIGADLIVVGRCGAEGGDSSSGLAETLRQAPCPVLIVYPSGRAAVA